MVQSMRILALSGLFLVVCVTSFTPIGDAAAAPDPWSGHSIDDAYSTEQIVLVSTVSQQGYTGEYYENRAYTCGRSGYQTFLIVYANGLPLTTVRPLWVRMHGGGVGAYNELGEYVPIEFLGANNQESITKLSQIMGEGGLVAKMLSHSAGFRFMLPSLCDHDVYSGVAIPDLNNPNSPDENGQTRAADGLLATKAAIAFTRNRVATAQVFLHGTSAGSIGSFGVAYSFGREGILLSGIVSDSHVMGRGINDNADLFCMPFPYDRALLLPKIGPLGSSELYPEDIVSAGLMSVPIYHLWNSGDPACCGSAIQNYTDDLGNPYTEPGCAHEHTPYRDAIGANPPGGPGRSVSVEVCVNDQGTTTPGACNLHSPSKYPYTRANPTGDQLTGGGDYNQAIVDWVDQRMADTLSVACPASPVVGCLMAARAKLEYSERRTGKEKMKLQWQKVAPLTVQGDFGDPVGGDTSAALCIYDDSRSLVEDFIVDRAGQVCVNTECWKAKGSKGYGYKDKASATDGISKIGYASGNPGKGRADARGKNNATKGQTSLPSGVVAWLTGDTAPTIQMITNDGFCVGATMNEVKKDDGLQYKAQLR